MDELTMIDISHKDLSYHDHQLHVLLDQEDLREHHHDCPELYAQAFNARHELHDTLRKIWIGTNEASDLFDRIAVLTQGDVTRTVDAFRRFARLAAVAQAADMTLSEFTGHDLDQLAADATMLSPVD